MSEYSYVCDGEVVGLTLDIHAWDKDPGAATATKRSVRLEDIHQGMTRRGRRRWARKTAKELLAALEDELDFPQNDDDE